MSKQAQASAPQQTAPRTESRDSSSMREYLDRAVVVLKKFGVDSTNTAPQELIGLLESVKHLDEAKVLAIADVIQHMSAFNALVRENVESIKIGNRYMDITQMFDSVREDSKRLIAQLDDGKISGTEKVSNWWMKIRRGTPKRSIREDRRSLLRCRQRHQGSTQERRGDHGRLHRLPIRAEGSRGSGP